MIQQIKWTDGDLKKFQQREISVKKADAQMECFEKGFPWLRIKSAASVENVIEQVGGADADYLVEQWNQYKGAEGHKITKFVPASGAASRMFKDLFAFLDGESDEPTTPFEQTFFSRIHDFAFFDALDDACLLCKGMGADTLMAEGRYKDVVACLLDADGLGYGQLPKGLLQFHAYEDCVRTPLEEHLTEAALYASSQGRAEVHFTVSPEHKELFLDLIERKVPEYMERHKVQISISLSEQKPSTDTIAATPDGQPFRLDNGEILFRPGGHGALIENLNDLESDIVFIKNIDNVVPDRLKADTVYWKQVIAGRLVSVQQQTFQYLEKLEKGECERAELEEMNSFMRNTLKTEVPDTDEMTDKELAAVLIKKLNRPMRVCGVVRNQGEPGGGPFLVYGHDLSIQPQILESSQINPKDEEAKRMFAEGTHFNPVDLVCGIRDYKGRPFDLRKFVDPTTGFISHKSKDGRELLALELPGLWNGAMSDWNTLMVEVPIETFNPVKTVNDLLRPQHQP